MISTLPQCIPFSVVVVVPSSPTNQPLHNTLPDRVAPRTCCKQRPTQCVIPERFLRRPYPSPPQHPLSKRNEEHLIIHPRILLRLPFRSHWNVLLQKPTEILPFVTTSYLKLQELLLRNKFLHQSIMLRICFRHGIRVGETHVPALLVVEGEVDHEANGQVPRMGELGVGPGG